MDQNHLARLNNQPRKIADSANFRIGDTVCLIPAFDRPTVGYTVHTFGKRSAGTQRYFLPITPSKPGAQGKGICRHYI